MTTSGVPGRDLRRLSGDGGAGLVEYALLASLIAVVCISAVRYFQQETSNSLSRSSSAITNAGS